MNPVGKDQPIIPTSQKEGAPKSQKPPQETPLKIDIKNTINEIANRKSQRKASPRPLPRTVQNQPKENFVKEKVAEVKNALSDDEFDLFNATKEDSIDRFEVRITEKDIEQIKTFVESIKEQFATIEEPTHFRSKDTGLPYSLLYMPESDSKGELYILLKDKGGHIEIGRGAGSRITKMLPLDPKGDEKVVGLRSALRSDIPEKEVEINKLIVKSSAKQLVAGVPFEYRGAWSPRKTQFPKSENVEKMGFIISIIKGDNLFQFIKNEGKLDLDTAIDKGIGCANAIAEAHNLGIVHGDIKLENFLIPEENGSVKLCDFGSSSLIGEDSSLGSPAYMAPEVFLSKPSHPSMDIWSLGCVLEELIGISDFSDLYRNSRSDTFEIYTIEDMLDVDKFELEKSIIMEDLIREGEIDQPIVKLLGACFNLDPEQRPTAKDIAKILNDCGFERLL